MEEYKISAYDETEHKGLVRHVLIRYGFVTKEIMVCLVNNGNHLPHGDILAERLAKIEGMTSITLSINKEKTNVIMGSQIELLVGEDLHYRLYRKCKVSDLAAVLLPGKSSPDGETIRTGA